MVKKRLLDYKVLLDEQFFVNKLNFFLNKLLSNLDRKATNDRDVLSKLKLTFKRKKAIRLFEFYNLYYSSHPNDRKSLKDNYHPSTIWRKKRDLVLAGVGIPKTDIPFEFSLDIPSQFVVNKSTPLTVVSGTSLGE